MITAIILVVGILTAICAFISATHKMYDESKQGFNRITEAGRWFILCGLILVVLPVIQNHFSEKEQKTEQDKRDGKMKKNYDASIIEIKNEYDKSSKASTTTITDILAKYGYKVDSINMVLVKIINDENKGKSTPVLGICGPPCKGVEILDSINGRYKIRITFSSADEGSSSIKLRVRYAIADSANNLFIVPVTFDSQEYPFPFKMKLPKGSNPSFDIEFKYNSGVSQFYAWVKGTYTRVDGSGSYSVNELYIFDPTTKVTSIITDESLKKKIFDRINGK